MSAAVVRYQTKPESADENQRLIEKVFAELAELKPAGLTYNSFRLADGVTFVHVASGDGLTSLQSFQNFQRELTDRLAVDFNRENATAVGTYSG